MVGVAPLVHQSGRYEGKRSIIGGRGNMWQVLYMATLTATRFNDDCCTRDWLPRETYKWLLWFPARGKLLAILDNIIRGR